MSVELHWIPAARGTQLALYAGDSDAEIACLFKRRTFWEAHVWLPGARRPARLYAPLEKQILDVEMIAREWFALVTAPRTDRRTAA